MVILVDPILSGPREKASYLV